MKMLNSRYVTFGILFLICLLAILLGSRMFFHGDYFFLYDQARDLFLVKGILYDHKLTMIGSRSGIGGFFHGPLWLYFLVPFFAVTHGNPLFIPFVGIVVTLITIMTAYFVGQKLYNRQVGLLLAFFLGIHEGMWGYITNMITANLLPLTYLLIFYSLISFLRGNKKMFILVAFFTGISFQFETASSLVLLPTIIVSYFTVRDVRRDLKLLAGSAISFLISMSWYFIFELRHKFLMTQSVIRYMTTQTKESGYLTFHERLPDHLNAFRSIFFAFLYRQNMFLVLLLSGIVLCGVFLIFRGREKEIKKELTLYLTFPLLIFIFLLRYPYPVYQEYILGLLVPMVYVIVLSLRALWQYRIGKTVSVAFVCLIGLITLLSVLQQYSRTYIPDTNPGSLRNQQTVIDWIYKQANGRQVGYFVYSPDTFTYQMDYLFWWKGRRVSHAAVSQKLQETYLVFYPPLNHDMHAYEFWKKNVLHISQNPIRKNIFHGSIAVEQYQLLSNQPLVDPNYYQQLIFR